jgi:hypothetical protein
MLNQFKYDKDAAIVMCNGGEPKIRTTEETRKFLSKLRTGNDNLWGWAMWKDRWQIIKPTFLNYYKLVNNVDYKYKDKNKIRNLFNKSGFLPEEFSQDVAMKYSFNLNNMIELNTFIQRGKYIGEHGIHMTPDLFNKSLHSKIKVYDFVEDSTLEKFDDYDKEKFKLYCKTVLVDFNLHTNDNK